MQISENHDCLHYRSLWTSIVTWISERRATFLAGIISSAKAMTKNFQYYNAETNDAMYTDANFEYNPFCACMGIGFTEGLATPVI